MVANLAENIQNSLTKFKITVVHGWSDSMVVIHWTKWNGIYKQFVRNWMNHINSKPPINWNYVSLDKNPANIGSRGCNASNVSKTWLEEPALL